MLEKNPLQQEKQHMAASSTCQDMSLGAEELN
jgi:hypothetical protein